MPYTGPDRRSHRVYVTRNTEYHVRNRTCVGVLDRQSGGWLGAHFAIDLAVAGSIRFYDQGGMTASPALPRIGDSLYFECSGRDLLTSSVVSVERPRSAQVSQYTD